MDNRTPDGALRPLDLGEAKAIGDVGSDPSKVLGALNAAGARLAVTQTSLVAWLGKRLGEHGHDSRGPVIGRFLDLVGLPERNIDDLRRLALGTSNERRNFHILFGPICRLLAQGDEEQRHALGKNLMGAALANTMGAGTHNVHPIDDPQHPFLDYLNLVFDSPALLDLLSYRWADNVLNKDIDYGLCDRVGSLWALDQLLAKGADPGQVLLELLDLQRHEDDERYWMALLLDRNALLSLAPGQVELDPARPWREEMIDAHPTSWRNRLLTAATEKREDTATTPKMRL